MSEASDPLEALFAEYREKLPRRRRALAALWKRLPEDDESAGVCAELRLQVHRLAGSAGAFGFDRLSAAAREVDQRLKAWLFTAPALRPPQACLIADLSAPFAALLDAFAESGASTPADGPLEAAGQAREVFHIEDDLEQARILGLNLERLGIRSTPLRDGEALFDRLTQHRPDAILLDYWLGAETGADLARAIRSTAGCERLPLLCLTSDIGDRVRLDALAAGCDEVMSKVQSAGQLAAAICAWVESALPSG